MRKRYSTQYVTCAICKHRYAGKVPKGGDGSILFPRKHYQYIPRSSNLGIMGNMPCTKEVCRGSFQEGEFYEE